MKIPPSISAAQVICWLLLAPMGALACSTFAVDTGGGMLFGRNTDGPTTITVPGMLVINKRGMEKVAAPWKAVGPSGDPALAPHWTSRYGSVTFTHFGREFPDGGVNEAGLIVEEMSLDGSQYPTRPGMPIVSVQQWIQYQLDNYGSVKEVRNNVQKLDIRGWPWHFTVADKSGACLIIEFSRGAALVHKGTITDGCVLTNDPIKDDAKRLAAVAKDGQPSPTASDSVSRFVRANALLQTPAPTGVDARAAYAFGVLSKVAQGPQTFRSIVYDLGAQRVYFRTYRHHQIKFIDITKIDFSPRSPVLTIDLESPASGDVTAKLRPYSPQENRRIVEGVFRLIRATPPVAKAMYRELAAAKLTEKDYIDRIASYPSTTRPTRSLNKTASRGR